MRKGFWERWSTRAAVIVAAIGTVVCLVVVGDPEHESWQTKTREVMHGLVIKTHSHHLGQR
ncbi:hypothetical protein [Mycobacterium sp.]|uniref:hypothetical protein n=1 Tax=Mycobacterium sp. TaxID=1785 RepID=UPI002D5F003F|nr:hypothetical protein [Mycobacterium sp.]HZA10038.1 hypothetical protein [Mycobacterium sp.]